MAEAFVYLGIFTIKAIIIAILILGVVAGIVAIVTKGKSKQVKGKISIKNLNEKYSDIKVNLLSEILPKKKFKKFIKEQKADKKKEKSDSEKQKNVYVVDFQGDMRATAVAGLREEITAILGIAEPEDEVLVRLESGGGMVHAYGLAAAQLQRVRDRNIALTVSIDKIAASGGYLMASIANKIVAAPFAIIGSIGVIVQIPNFHRLLKEKNIDFEQLTAGSFKRTLTIFGQNTKEGREKLQEEIEEIHELFKNVIQKHRKQIDIDKVATGEHWLGSQALGLKLVDELITSDDYLVKKSHAAHVYEVNFLQKKSLAERFTSGASALKRNLFEGTV